MLSHLGKVSHFSTMNPSDKRTAQDPQKGPEKDSQKDPQTEQQEESRCQPFWHVIVLNILTLFAYSLFWFFKNWSQLGAYAREHIESSDWNAEKAAGMRSLADSNALLWSALLLLPGIQMVATTRLFADIVRISPVQWVGKRYPFVAGGLFTATMVGLLCLAKLPDNFYLLFLTGCLPLAAAQWLLNAFWKDVEPPGLLVRQAFSVGELFCVIIGSLVLGLIVVGLLNGTH